MGKVNVVDKGYIESGVWKCDKSPTGAHHWVEIQSDHTKGLFYCIHCFDVKKFPLTLEEASRVTRKSLHMDLEDIKIGGE